MLFRKKKSYIQKLLSSKDATVFVEGIMKDPARFFAEAKKDPTQAVRDICGVLEYAAHQFGQSAILLGITGALKVAAKKPGVPAYAPKLAEQISDDLMKAFKRAMAG